MSRKLIIDGQLFQTPAWHRGMGKYSLELISSLLKVNKKEGWQEVIIVLSSNIEDTENVIPELRRKLVGINIVELDLLPKKFGDHIVIPHNRKAVDEYVDGLDGQESDFLILSLMQSEIYPVFPTSRSVNKLLLFYDLIPLTFHDIYLKNPVTRSNYTTKLKELFLADKYLAISKTVANDLAIYLGIDKKRIFSIDGGPIDHSAGVKKYEIDKPFVLMPTGNDLRKNNRLAIMGFEEFNQKNNNKYKLVITSFFKDFEIEELKKLSNNVVFTGNVSGEELSYLYEHSAALLFPPTYEGLGLPILEALKSAKPVVCSDISVFREMSKTAFNFFNPYSVSEIRDVLQLTLGKPEIEIEEYERVLKKYTWGETSTKFIKAACANTQKQQENRPKVAVFATDASKYNVSAKLVQDNHAELSRKLQPDYILATSKNPEELRINHLAYSAKQYIAKSGLGFRPEAYDACIYHFANSAEYAPILPFALAVPGILVLHDISLEKVWSAAVEEGFIHPARAELERSIEKSYMTSLIANQKAVVVFNANDQKKVEKLAAKVNKNLKITNLNYPVNTIAYEEVLPTKTITSSLLDDIPRQTDFQFYEGLSRHMFVIAERREQYQTVLEAMGYRVIPCVTEEDNLESLPRDCKVSDKDISVAQAEAITITGDSRKTDLLSKNAAKHVHSQHKHNVYADNIYNIVMNITPDTSKDE